MSKEHLTHLSDEELWRRLALELLAHDSRRTDRLMSADPAQLPKAWRQARQEVDDIQHEMTRRGLQ